MCTLFYVPRQSTYLVYDLSLNVNKLFMIIEFVKIVYSRRGKYMMIITCCIILTYGLPNFILRQKFAEENKQIFF